MDGLGKRILDALKLYKNEFDRKVLKTREEVEANTSDKYLVAAAVVGELINNLPEFIYDSEGKITGYKTVGGADTVFPFSGNCTITIKYTMYCSRYRGSSTSAEFVQSKSGTITVKVNGDTATIANSISEWPYIGVGTDSNVKMVASFALNSVTVTRD